ncbi:2-C-methyl-D-erythritol 2,4-cyclodiphosphate synthase [Candidatus Desulfarcum epimagneticum]|uniref:2-C-methyl-D-erythritol 2,4-cyclodiphosphate synthase n=1 Tax=uncultured Desulfobacteraceae bacterium TaxID=218296 RepID=A0A484HKW0_9BACT|nr:2-C-methyl-D-erythritol 2,4-cyclodiphosphate synthase [uncultured Desulfobacteraceae bacterium]
MRVGTGYDVHRLVPGRKLILGGVNIPFEKGLLGHSDADALVHSVCDALLGAAGMDDIGAHFPDASSEFKDISSLILLERTAAMIRKKGFSIVNVDATVFAQAPRISPHKSQMREKLSQTLGISSDRVNIKATTSEGLGMIGEGEGIGAMCSVLLEEKD